MNLTLIFTPFSAILIVAVLTSLIAVITSWRHRKSPIGKPFLFLAASILGWTITTLLETSVVGLEAKQFAAKLNYVSVIHVGPLFLIFCAKYVRQDSWLNQRTTPLLWIIPIFVLILVWTNDYHSLYWIGFIPNPDIATNLYFFKPGILYWIFPTYFYMCYFAGCTFLLKGLILTNKIYHKPILSILIGTLLPFIGSLVYFSDFNPLPGLDFTALTFSFTCILYSTAIHRLDLLNIAPIARTNLVDVIVDGMVVINPDGYVADINPSARKMISNNAISPIGKPIFEIFSDWSDFLSIINSDKLNHLVKKPGMKTCFYNIQIQLIFDNHQNQIGKLFIFHDITSEYQAKEDLARKEENLQLLFDASPFPLLISRVSDGMVIRANQAAFTLFEDDSADLSKYRTLDFYHDLADRERIVHKVLTTGKIQANEVELISRTGKHFWTNLNIVKIDFMGETCFLVGIVDITALRDAKVQLQRLNTSLEESINRANQIAAVSERNALQLQLLRDVGTVITASLDRDQTIERVLEQLTRMVQFNHAMITLRQENINGSSRSERGVYGCQLCKKSLPTQQPTA